MQSPQYNIIPKLNKLRAYYRICWHFSLDWTYSQPPYFSQWGNRYEKHRAQYSIFGKRLRAVIQSNAGVTSYNWESSIPNCNTKALGSAVIGQRATIAWGNQPNIQPASYCSLCNYSVPPFSNINYQPLCFGRLVYSDPLYYRNTQINSLVMSKFLKAMLPTFTVRVASAGLKN